MLDAWFLADNGVQWLENETEKCQALERQFLKLERLIKYFCIVTLYRVCRLKVRMLI